MALALMLVSVNARAGEVVAIDCPPKSIDAGFAKSVGDAAAVTKRAPTDFAAFAVTEHAPVPEHAPDQPMKTDPASATAARLTDVPALKLAAHVAPHATPAGVEVIVPAPVPDFATVSGYVTTDADLMQLAGERVSVPLARTNDVQAVEVVVPSVTWETCAMTGERPINSHALASERAQRPIRFILTFPLMCFRLPIPWLDLRGGQPGIREGSFPCDRPLQALYLRTPFQGLGSRPEVSGQAAGEAKMIQFLMELPATTAGSPQGGVNSTFDPAEPGIAGLSSRCR